MLIRFTDDYTNHIYAGWLLVGKLQSTISNKEPFVGNSKQLDRYYAQSVVISALLDHLEFENNNNPKMNEQLLQCLKSIIAKNPGCLSQAKKQPINKGRFIITEEDNTNNSGPISLDPLQPTF